MFTTTTKTRSTRPQRFLLRHKRGWIGVDVGSILTKLAQVERLGDGYRIAARWSLPTRKKLELQNELQPADGDFDFSQAMRQARRICRGRRAAAALSACYTTHRYIDLPDGDDHELRRMIGEEIVADTGPGSTERCFDYWQSAGSTDASRSMVQLSVIDIDRDVSLQLVRDLSGAGLDCRILDGVPCSLARAAAMFDPQNTAKPRVMLDIGYSSTVFVAVLQGLPVFTRVLRGCGLEAVVQPIQQSLSLTATEAIQLVRRTELGPTQNDLPPDAAARVVHQLLSEPVTRLVSEIARTLDYLRHGPVAMVPEQIVLSGGGATLPYLIAKLKNESELEVVGWRLSTAQADSASHDDSLYAVAAALSALAWEA